MSLGPAALYSHDNHDVENVNTEFREQLTYGQKLADKVAKGMGCWEFIIIQSILIIIWVSLNVYFLETELVFDPYPFILLNLGMSLQAAYAAPIIMMSQNRQAAKDRMTAELDYKINQIAEEEIKVIMEHLAHQDKLTLQILHIVNRLEAK